MEIVDKYDDYYDFTELKLIQKKENIIISELHFGLDSAGAILLGHKNQAVFSKIILDDNDFENDDLQPKTFNLIAKECLDDWKTVIVPKDKRLNELYYSIYWFFDESVKNNCALELTKL